MKSLRDTLNENMQVNESTELLKFIGTVVEIANIYSTTDLVPQAGTKVFANLDKKTRGVTLNTIKDSFEFIRTEYGGRFNTDKDIASAAKDLDNTKVGEKWSIGGTVLMIRLY